MTLDRDEQHAKDHLETVSMDEGRQIDRSDEQLQKAPWPSSESLLLPSNVTVKSCAVEAKQSLEMTSIDEGMQIDFKDGQIENAD
jgi:hypothetical protein